MTTHTPAPARTPASHRKPRTRTRLTRRGRITVLAAALLTGAGLALGGQQAAAHAASEPVRTAFCLDFQRFGGKPTYQGLAHLHYDARFLHGHTRAEWQNFQRLLLGGYPRWQLRRAAVRVYANCTGLL
jgi:hypothetical protein